jgi:hypothetical protein
MRTLSAILCLLTVALAPSPARAVELFYHREDIAFDRPESWAMKYFASATLLTGFGPPRPLRFLQLRIGAEADWLPHVSPRQRVVGFNGTKAEDLNKLPAIGRLRITLGLPFRMSLTVSYMPPIPINGVEPNLLSLSLGMPLSLTPDFTLGVSSYGQYGFVEGAFTCPDFAVRAGADPQLNPYGCVAVSNDHVELDYFGVELSASYRIASAHGLEPYGSVAVNYMNLSFRVAARYGEVDDRTMLHTDGATFSMTAGLLFPITRRLDLASEAFYSPLTVQRPPAHSDAIEGLFNVRGLIAYRFF